MKKSLTCYYSETSWSHCPDLWKTLVRFDWSDSRLRTGSGCTLGSRSGYSAGLWRRTSRCEPPPSTRSAEGTTRERSRGARRKQCSALNPACSMCKSNGEGRKKETETHGEIKKRGGNKRNDQLLRDVIISCCPGWECASTLHLCRKCGREAGSDFHENRGEGSRWSEGVLDPSPWQSGASLLL